MKKILFISVLCVSQISLAKAKILACPKKDRAMSAITTGQPGSMEDLQRKIVKPAANETPNTWDLAPYAQGGKQKLYLSCASTRGFIMAKRIPLKGNNCKVIDANADLRVECK